MGPYIKGNKLKHIGGNLIIPKQDELAVQAIFELDTIIASKEWVKDHLDEIKEWSEQK